jgi:O-antigen/teichoic acid export membrane protein
MNKSLIKKIKKDSIGTLLMKGGYIILGFISSILLARFLGATQYGEYSYLISIMTIVIAFIEFGFPTFLIRKISELNINENIESIVSIIWNSLYFLFFISILGSFIAYTFIEYTSIGNKEFYYCLIPIAISMTFSSYRASIMRGLNKVIIGQFPDEIGKPLLMIIFIISFVYIFEIELTTLNLLQINIATSIVILIVGYKTLFSQIDIIKLYKKNKFDIQVFKETTPYFLLALLLILQQNIDVLMIGKIMSMQDVGIYKIAIMNANLIGLTLMAISMAIMPNISKLYKEKQYNILQSIIVKGHKYAFILALPILVVFFFLGKVYLVTIFGDEYANAYIALNILAFGKLFYAGIGLIGTVFNMIGLSWYVTINAFFIVFINFILNYFLIPIYGIEGAAIATILSQLGANIILIIVFYRKFNLNLSLFGKQGLENE